MSEDLNLKVCESFSHAGIFCYLSWTKRYQQSSTINGFGVMNSRSTLCFKTFNFISIKKPPNLVLVFFVYVCFCLLDFFLLENFPCQSSPDFLSWRCALALDEEERLKAELSRSTKSERVGDPKRPNVLSVFVRHHMC